MILKNSKQKGFTLIELLVVVAIISLLSSIVMASLNSARSKARDAKRKTELRQLALADEMYFNDVGSYIGLTGYFSNILYYGVQNTSFGALIPSYIPSLPLDPLYPQRDYIYLTKDWDTCDGGNNQPYKYAFYGILENPSTSDPNYISATVGDSFDKCVASNWSMNYRVGN